MIKYVGAFIFAVCASLYGFQKSGELKRLAKECKELCGLARGIASYIDKLKLPLCEIYKRLAPSNKLAKYLLDGEDGKRALLQSGIAADKELEKKLSYFLENIGGGFCDEELALCKELEEAAKQRQSFYEKEYQSKAVLYRSLGLICALAAVIVVA